MHVPFLFSWIMMPGLLLEIVLSVRACCFLNLVTLTLRLVLTDYYQYYFVHYLIKYLIITK